MNSPKVARRNSSSIRTAETKQKLFSAALRLIGEHGLSTITVDQIATEAQVAKGTVYYNFGSKDALVDELLKFGVELLKSRLLDAVERPRPLTELVDVSLAFFAEYTALAQLLAGDLWRTEGRWHTTLFSLREEVLSIIIRVLRTRNNGSRPAREIDVDTAAAALFGTLVVVALDWQVFHPERSHKQVRDSIIALMSSVTE